MVSQADTEIHLGCLDQTMASNGSETRAYAPIDFDEEV